MSQVKICKNVAFNPNDNSPLMPLVEGRDYYVENGFWVFTSHYLKKRGKCCKSGCKNCPFKKK